MSHQHVLNNNNHKKILKFWIIIAGAPFKALWWSLNASCATGLAQETFRDHLFCP